MIAALVNGPADGRVLQVLGARTLRIPVQQRFTLAEIQQARSDRAPLPFLRVAVYQIVLRTEEDLLYGFAGYE